MKTKKIIIIFIILIVVYISFNLIFLNKDISKYITEDIDGFIYLKQSKLLSYINSGKKESEDKSLKFITRVIKNIFLIHTKSEENFDRGYIIAIDPGQYYPLILMYLKYYFKKDNNNLYYFNNNQKMPFIIKEIFKNVNFFTDNGIIFISKYKKNLIKYKESLKNKKNKVIYEYWVNNKNKDIIICFNSNVFFQNIIDGKYIKSLEYFLANGEINKKEDKLRFLFEQTGNGEIFNLLSVKKVKKRELAFNVAEGDTYIANDNLPELIKFLIKKESEKNNKNYFELIEEVFSISLEELIDLLGNELVFNIKNGKISGVVLLKEQEKAEEYFRDILIDDYYGIYNFEGLKFTIKDNKLFAGDNITFLENKSEIDENTFLYLDGELYFIKNLKNLYVNANLKNKDNKIYGTINLEKKIFRRVLNYFYLTILKILS